MPEPTAAPLTGKHHEIVVHEWPNDDAGHVVLLIHGYGEHARRYDHVADALVAAGAVVYAPDHFGHGESEGEPASVTDMDDFADDVATLEQQVRDAHPGLPVVVLGHSMGGLIATRLAQRDPSRYAALVLSAPVVGGNPELFGLLELPEIPPIPLDPAALSRDPSVGEAYAADPLVYHGPFRRETLQAFADATDRIAADPSFGALPTLWIHGENDALAPYDATKQAMDHLRGDLLEEKVYPGAMHEIFNETNRGEVIDDTIGFIRRQVGRTVPHDAPA